MVFLILYLVRMALGQRVVDAHLVGKPGEGCREHALWLAWKHCGSDVRSTFEFVDRRPF